MRVIVTTRTDITVEGYKVVDSFNALRKYIPKIEVLIFNSTNETPLNVGLVVAEMKKKGVKKFIYVNSEPEAIFTSIITALKGIIQRDEFFLTDKGSLDFLCEEENASDGITDLVPESSINIISDFVQAFVSSDSKINNEYYLGVVRTAIQDTRKKMNGMEVTLRDTSESVVATFDEASKIINDMSTKRKELEEQFYSVQKMYEETTKEKSSSVIFFPTFRYNNMSKVLHIKEKSHCRYLFSFLMSYQDYLAVQYHKKVKLILTFQKFKDTSEKYKDIVTVTSDTIRHSKLVLQSIVSTSTPKKEVMEILLGGNEDIYIVLDRMYGDPIIAGHDVVSLNAVSGVSDVLRFNIPPAKTLFSIVGHKDAFGVVPHISNYPNDVDSRKHSYFSVCKELYAKFDKLLGVR